MRLLVRDKSEFVNFVHNISELRDFVEAYVPGTRIVLGDISTFSKQMVPMLLKLTEENPQIDCYSSLDIVDPVLLSRFREVVKVPLEIRSEHSEKDFMLSDRSFSSTVAHLELPDTSRLLAVGASKTEVALLSLSLYRG
jgi:hypothetical protein